MDSFVLFWGIVLMVLVLLFFGIPFLLYIILRKSGEPRMGKIVGLCTLGIFILTVNYFVFEDYFFFKRSVSSRRWS